MLEEKRIKFSTGDDIISAICKAMGQGMHQIKACRSGRINYSTWEFAYFEQLIIMRDLLVKEMEDAYPGQVGYLCTEVFFKNFARLVYKKSSGKIAPFLRPMSMLSEEEYSKYRFKNETKEL